MASPPTPDWVKLFIGAIAAVVIIVVALHLTGVMPHMHAGMP